MWLALGSTTWVARRSPSAPIRAMYIQLIGRMLALPWAAAETMPTEGAVPSPSSAARTFPSPAGGRGAVRGRKGARCDFTAHGPTPGPPPPGGMQKVLCRLRGETSEPHLPGGAAPLPTGGGVPPPAAAGRDGPAPAGGGGAGRGRKGARCDFTAHGPTPGPPPPCGMQKVLCRLRCETSEPHLPGRATPTRAFMLAPSVYTCPPCLCTISQISTTSSSNTPCVDG